jgi:anti-sigma B factor antagonist
LQDPLRHLALRTGDQVVVDLAGVAFCDSSGITALLAARNRALHDRATITLADVPTHVVTMLRVFGLLTVLPTAATAEAAVTSWNGHRH